MVTLFTYGTLMSGDIMHHVAAAQFNSAKAVLEDHFRSKILSEEYPALIPHKGSSVSGIVYFDISRNAMLRLDMFEGEMYERRTVEVSLSDGERCKTMTYIFKPEYGQLLTWEPWNYEEFLVKGKNDFIKKYAGFQVIG